MAQMDDSVGEILKHLDDIGEAENTIVIFTTDNGAEVYTWPDGGMTPFKAAKGTHSKAASACLQSSAGPDTSSLVRLRTVSSPASTGSRLCWHAAGNPDITNQLLKGVKLGDRTYKNHLDGYNQTAMLEGTGPSARHELFYFSGAQLGALRIDDFKYQFLQQPWGWPGEKIITDMPDHYKPALGSLRAPVPTTRRELER